MGPDLVLGRFFGLGWPRLLVLAVCVLLLAVAVWWVLFGSTPVNVRTAAALVLGLYFCAIGNFIRHLCRGFSSL